MDQFSTLKGQKLDQLLTLYIYMAVNSMSGQKKGQHFNFSPML